MATKYFTLSYDDGVEQDKRLIELFKKYGIKGTFNISAGLFGYKDRILRIGNSYTRLIQDNWSMKRLLFKNHKHYVIPEDEVVQVYEGFEVASHGYMHECMPLLTDDQLKATISRDVSELSKLMGYPITGHAYPFGATNERVQNALKAQGLTYGRGVCCSNTFEMPITPYCIKPTCWHGSKDTLNLLEQFIGMASEADSLFYMYGHSYELDYGTKRNSWKMMEYICQRISEQSDIVCLTNSELFSKLFNDADQS